ncbi:MAG: hypothetical protein ACK5MY_15960 [Jhaorihella sp.]
MEPVSLALPAAVPWGPWWMPVRRTDAGHILPVAALTVRRAQHLAPATPSVLRTGRILVGAPSEVLPGLRLSAEKELT